MIKATYSNIIVKVHYEQQLGDRIVLADSYVKQTGKRFGEVVAIGPNNKLGVSIGDKVLFQLNEGYKINYNNEEYISLRQHYVEAIIK